MAAAARAHAAEFGLDLGSRDMIAFGGAAPLHAARLGEKLGVRRIVIPADAGVGSAVGFLLAPVAYEVVRSRYQALSELRPDVVNTLMAEMRAEALAVVRQGVGPLARDAELGESRHAYMRYRGQGHEIPVALPVAEYSEADRARFRDAFEAAYRQLYGRTIDGVEIEALSWTLTIAEKGTGAIKSKEKGTGAIKSKEKGTGAIEFNLIAPVPFCTQPLLDPATGNTADAPVYLRSDLDVGARVPGPALITEDQTTTVVAAGWAAVIDARGSIVLSRREEPT
jgi:N-methylhydantoinase A